MQNLTDTTVREIAIASPETTRVFEEFKIDYCCGGNKPFADACIDAGLDPAIVAEKIAAMVTKFKTADDAPTTKSPSELIDYILSTHHVFTKGELDRLSPLMEKVCSRHGERHPELFELQTLFNELSASLLPHMQKEEMVLFPYVKVLESSHGNAPPPPFGTVRNPIRMMMVEHDTDGERLRKMREITKDYQLPEGACPTYGALFDGLLALERDLHQHIHLENNVLFPAAAELEPAA